MRTLLRFSFAMLIAIALFSCSKDDGDSTPSATEGQLTAEINGSNTTFQVYATKVVTEEDGTVIYIFGTSTDGQKSFALWVLANSVTARTYPIPSYSEGYEYDTQTGYGMGMYWEGTAQTVDEEWVSFEIEGSSGSITITDISNTNVKGTFDLTMVNLGNQTSTMDFNGSFNANFLTY